MRRRVRFMSKDSALRLVKPNGKAEFKKTAARFSDVGKQAGGFTLVEVVLAIAILAIISVPLINYFSQSMGYNTLMASRQHATHLAQEVAEELKEQERLVQPTGDDHTEYTIPYLTGKNYSETVESVSGGDGDYNWKAVYTGLASDIDKNYDVVVTASATEPASDSENGEVYGMDASTDVLVDDTGADNEALIYFKAVNTSYCNNNDAEKLDNDQILANMSREIDIDIAQSGTMYTVDVTYCYTCTGLRGSEDKDEYEINVLVDELQQGLKNIYLLYHPLESQDKVVVSLSGGCTGEGMGLYLACQEYDENSNDFSGYTVSVTCSEWMTIYSNVGTVYINGVGLSPEPLTGEFNALRVVELQVDVYKKGETGSADPYITVHASKSE